jgi:amino acid transporter
LYAFVGFEVAVIPAGEMKDPQKILPFALFVALGIVTLIYILVQVVSIGTLDTLAKTDRPLADAASAFMGPVGAAFIAAGALVSIIGNLNVGLLGSSRLIYAMGEHGEMPQIVAKTHDRFKTPYLSIIINALIILVFAIQTSFLTAVAIATITRLFVYATTCIALPVFRFRQDVPEAKFIAPMGIVVAILSVVLIIWLLTTVDYTKEGLPIVILAAIGLVLYFVFRAFRRSSVS